MKIESAKDLAKLIALCRKTGVNSIKVGDIEFHLGAEPQKTVKAKTKQSFIQTEASQGPDVITDDEMTPEQLLMWSVTGSPESSAAEDTN